MHRTAIDSPSETVMRLENAAERIHRELRHQRQVIQDLREARFQLALCNCRKRVAGYDEKRCEHCGTWTRHCVEMQLSEGSLAALFLGAV
jgi:rRNA maturation endonuclease Nob1